MQISKSPAAFYSACRKTKSQASFARVLHSLSTALSFLCTVQCFTPFALRTLCSSQSVFVSLFLRFSLSGLYRWYGNLTRSAMIPAPPYQSPRTYRTNLLPSPPAKPQLTKLQPYKLTNLSSAKQQPCKPSNPHVCRPKPRLAKLQTYKSATNLQIRLPMQDIPRVSPPVRNLTSP